jgi:hypothetical protein
VFYAEGNDASCIVVALSDALAEGRSACLWKSL